MLQSICVTTSNVLLELYSIKNVIRLNNVIREIYCWIQQTKTLIDLITCQSPVWQSHFIIRRYLCCNWIMDYQTAELIQMWRQIFELSNNRKMLGCMDYWQRYTNYIRIITFIYFIVINLKKTAFGIESFSCWRYTHHWYC